MAEAQEKIKHLEQHIEEVEKTIIPKLFSQITKLRINLAVHMCLVMLQLGVMTWTLQQTFAMRGEISSLQQAIIGRK